MRRPRIEYDEHWAVRLHLAILGHEDRVQARHDAYGRVNPEHRVLENAVARDDGPRHLISFLARRIDDSFRGTGRTALHEIQLNRAEVLRNGAQKVLRN